MIIPKSQGICFIWGSLRTPNISGTKKLIEQELKEDRGFSLKMIELSQTDFSRATLVIYYWLSFQDKIGAESWSSNGGTVWSYWDKAFPLQEYLNAENLKSGYSIMPVMSNFVIENLWVCKMSERVWELRNQVKINTVDFQDYMPMDGIIQNGGHCFSLLDFCYVDLYF